MKIIRTYILKEMLVPFFLALGVLTCVFLLGNLIPLTNMVINKGVSLAIIGRVFLLYIPVLLGYTLPVACLVSVIFAFSRLSVDNEILAMRASGIHLKKLLYPLTLIGVMASLFSVILNERMIPYAHYEQQKTLKTLGINNPTALLDAGMFIDAFESQILFIHKIEGNKMYNVTIYQPQPNGPTRTIMAKRGEFTPVPDKSQIKLKLMDGTSDEPNLENPDNLYKLNFKNYFMTLDFEKKKETINKKPKSMTLKELQEAILKLDRVSVDSARLRTEYWRKITWSFSPFFFMILGFPMAVITHRREKSVNVILAVLCAAFYYLLSLGCEGVGIQNMASPEIIMWIPNMIAAIVGGILIFRCVS